jgi:hypothetical protein
MGGFKVIVYFFLARRGSSPNLLYFTTAIGIKQTIEQ